jgi:hypothetical protein
MKTILTLTLLAAQAGVSYGQSGEAVARDAGTQKPMCLCAFQLAGTSKKGVAGGMVGGLAGAAIAGRTSYFGDISKEVQQVYEAAFKESGAFPYAGSDKLVVAGDVKNLALSDTAEKNKLLACARAKPYWAARPGWNKKIAIFTKWEIAGPGGCKLKFNTSVASQDTHGKFPNGADPKMKAVYLELSKEDAKQFVQAFQNAKAKKSACGQ